MLTIDRNINQNVFIGNKELIVLEIKERNALISFDGIKYRIKHGQSITCGATEVFFIRQFGNNRVRLGFDGPKSVNILRGELKNKNSKYIDNSTKQFPSGDF